MGRGVDRVIEAEKGRERGEERRGEGESREVEAGHEHVDREEVTRGQGKSKRAREEQEISSFCQNKKI